MGWAGQGSLLPAVGTWVQRQKAAGRPGSAPGPALSSWWERLPAEASEIAWGHRAPLPGHTAPPGRADSCYAPRPAPGPLSSVCRVRER